MPILGYKRKFKNIKSLCDEVFIVNFDLEYDNYGALKIKNEVNNYFDVGDYNILLDDIFNKFTEEEFKRYDNGIYILSICKYITDKIPNIYSITCETKTMKDTYYKQEIIDNYNKIQNYKILDK